MILKFRQWVVVLSSAALYNVWTIHHNILIVDLTWWILLVPLVLGAGMLAWLLE